MTKEEICQAIKKSGCKMAEKFDPLNKLTKDELVYHLQRACCPVLKELCKAK
jgi:hypothetical protein